MQSLFKKYLDDQCSLEEMIELLAHFNNTTDEAALRELIRQNLETGFSKTGIAAEHGLIVNEIYNSIKEQLAAQKAKVIPFFKKTWFRVAASTIIGLLVLSWFMLRNQHHQADDIIAKQDKKIEKDIKPGTDKAILTLADGSTVVLDNNKNGLIAQQGSANVIKTNEGQVTYNNSSVKASEVFYNTISTPRGGQYQLVLPDGSKVWLNAASSVHFPSAFVGKERKVEITGEVYFEVAKNAAVPFKVEAAGMEIEVLGTHFNINAYSDEPVLKTTLLEGKVKVSASNGVKKMFLSPGQQSVLNKEGELQLVDQVDIAKTMAWKNGKFIFTNDNIQSVMRQLSRWYDIDVEYKGKATAEEFVGMISRYVNISQILAMLENTGAVSFEVKDRKVIVK